MHTINLSFDMRAPDFGAPARDLYPAALDMIAYADANGFEAVIFPEHHCSPDGYNPVPALMATAAAARTKTIDIVLGAIVLPLHDPVKVAEQIAVTDLICGGRLHAVLVGGYSEIEFKAFRKSMRDRAKLMDHGVQLIMRALAGERFQDGDREVFVRPLPLSQPLKLYLGGGVAAAARRAARFGLGFWGLNDAVIPVYEEECRKLGRAPGLTMRTSVAVHVAEDPDAAWAQIGPHMVHMVRSYASWSGDAERSASPFHGLDTIEAIRKAGLIQVVTPDACVALAKKKPLSLAPLLAGLAPKIGWESLELFTAKVLPRLKAAAKA